jgi:arylsulfatase A-like enzyme
VIFVVLESVGSQYMGLYGGRFPSTPRLDAESRHSLIFDNIYSHSVWSSSALLAMTISRYPKITWRQSTEDEPQMPGEALGTLLRSRGRRTAFMTPSTLTWARWDLFLSGRGFDRVLTADHLGVPFSTSWGVDDRVVFDRALHWLDEDSDRPFFLMIWTMQGHHPYVPAKDQPVVEYPTAKDPLHNNFLNCLWETDRQLGRLFDGLRRRKLDQNTLVVIVGDHGEAFGEPHAVWSHGMWLYEECIKVPCILWYPPFFQGERRDTVGGHLDLNPTITDLLSLPPESTWQGRSLFDPNRLSRAFVFSANGDYRLGIRDGNWKYIYNANEGGHELFDLASDPDEQTNLADQRADVARQMRRHLSAWVAAGRK